MPTARRSGGKSSFGRGALRSASLRSSPLAPLHPLHSAPLRSAPLRSPPLSMHPHAPLSVPRLLTTTAGQRRYTAYFYAPNLRAVSILQLIQRIPRSSRPAGRDYVELPDPATDGPGKCRGIPRGTRPSDERRALDRPQKLYSTVPWRTAPRFYGASRLQRNVVRAALASVAHHAAWWHVCPRAYTWSSSEIAR